MTTTEAFEALMPEPAAHRYLSHGHSSRWQLAGRAVPPDAEPLYTAEQMRAMFDAATERAAKLCEDVNEPDWYGYECPNTFRDGVVACAAAIRARDEGVSNV